MAQIQNWILDFYLNSSCICRCLLGAKCRCWLGANCYVLALVLQCKGQPKSTCSCAHRELLHGDTGDSVGIAMHAAGRRTPTCAHTRESTCALR